MSYSTSTPPAMIGQRVGGGGALWMYQSTDVHTDVDATDYFSNGDDLPCAHERIHLSQKCRGP